MLFSAGVTISLLSSLVAAQDYGYGGGGGGSPPTTASSSAAPIPTAPADTDGHKNVRINQLLVGGLSESPTQLNFKTWS